MVNCTFCGYVIPVGTGKMLVLKDGKIQYFCTMKCEKNMHKLGRKPRHAPWTKAANLQKIADKIAAAHGGAKTEPAKAAPVKAAPAKKPSAPATEAPKA